MKGRRSWDPRSPGSGKPLYRLILFQARRESMGGFQAGGDSIFGLVLGRKPLEPFRNWAIS